jgi:hypothetical protein
MDAAKRLLLLPLEAQKRFDRLANEQRLMKLEIDAQKLVITDLTRSLGDVEEIEKAIQETNGQLTAVDERLAQTSALLLEQLTESTNQSGDNTAKEFLKLVISKVQSSVNGLALEGVSQGTIAVSVLSVVALEDQIRKIIEDLQQKDMYPESAEDAEARVTETHQHMTAVMQFLQQFLREQRSES